MRAITVFRLRLTKPAQHRRVTAAVRDNATMISLGWRVSCVSASDPPRRDQQSQGAVYGRSCRDSAVATTRNEAHMRCTQGASKTFTKWSVHVPPPLIVGDMTSLCEATDRCRVRCPQRTFLVGEKQYALRQRATAQVATHDRFK